MDFSSQEWLAIEARIEEKQQEENRRKQQSHALAMLRVNGHALLGGARVRAARHEVPFSITIDWVMERLLRGKCELTGLPFDPSNRAYMRSNFSPTLDRRVPKLGYTPENCRVVIWAYNAAKSSGTDEDVMKMAEALVRRKAEKNGASST